MRCEECWTNNLATAEHCIKCGNVLPGKHETEPKLKPRNYFIALGYIVFASVAYWFMWGEKHDFMGILRILGFIFAFLITVAVIASMDSDGPRHPKNRPILRTVLATLIMGGTAYLFGSLWQITFIIAAIGAIFGVLGWSWVKHASI